MARKPEKPIRLTITRWSTLVARHPRTVAHELGKLRIDPGEDGKYSLLDLVRTEREDPSDRAARIARNQEQIDRADQVRMDLETQRGRLAEVRVMKDVLADVVTRLVQMIKHSSLSKKQKDLWIAEITDVRFEPTRKNLSKHR